MTEIHIFGSASTIQGDFPTEAIRQSTSYAVQGAEYSPSYRKGLWDGRKHLFNKKNSSFPTGLVSIIKQTCEESGYDVGIVDHRMRPAPQGKTFDLHGIKMEGKYDYQLDAAKTMVDKMQGIVKIATNGGKTAVAASVIRYLELPTLFLVTTVELMYQAQKVFQLRFQATDKEVGVIGDGVWEPGSWVTVAMVPTLEKRINTKKCIDFLSTIDVLFYDECHHVPSDTSYAVTTLCPAFYRYGLSGTPIDRTDGSNLKLIAATGDIIVNISNKFLVERGVSARAEIIFDKVTTPQLPPKMSYPTAYKEGIVENEEMLSKVVEWTKVFHSLNLGTLILVEEIEHGKSIDTALWNATGGMFIPHQFISGKETSEVRDNALKEFAKRELPVLISSRILDEGVDVPTIDALILAGSRKSTIKTLQRLGRGLRGERLIAVEFANFCQKHLLKHSLERLEDYKAEDCFPIHKYKDSQDKKELVQKLLSKPLVKWEPKK